MKVKFGVFCNNEVQKKLLGMFEKNKYDCSFIDVLNKENIRQQIKGLDKIILPFPSIAENLDFLSEEEKLSSYLSKNQVVIGGLISEELKEELEDADIKYIDYFNSEAYVLKNAYLTSQGAVKLLLNSTTYYLPGKQALVTGFGRIGKSLALSLRNLGLRVYIAARSETALADAEALGFEVFKLSQMKGTLFYYDFIFNTVPSKIFFDKDIEHIRVDATYFELASSPYGADKKLFEDFGKKHILASALPGKHFPDAVAENIFSFIKESEMIE